MFRKKSKRDKGGVKKARTSQASMPIDDQPVETVVGQVPVKSVVKRRSRRVRISPDVLRSRLSAGDVAENKSLSEAEIARIIQDILCVHDRYYFFRQFGDKNVKNNMLSVEVNDVCTFVDVIAYAKKSYIESISLCAKSRYLDAYTFLRRIRKILSGNFLYDLEAAALSARAKMAADVVLNLSKMSDAKAADLAWQYFLINDQVVQMFVNVLLGAQKLLLGDSFYGNFLSNGIAADFDDNFRELFFREIKVFDFLVLMLAVHMPKYLLPPTVIELEGSLYGPRGMVASVSRVDLYDEAEKIEGFDAGRCHQRSCEKAVFGAFGITEWDGLFGVKWSEQNSSMQLLGKAVHVMHLVHSLSGHFLPLDGYEIAHVDEGSVKCYLETQLPILNTMLSVRCENYGKLLELQTRYKKKYQDYQSVMDAFMGELNAIAPRIAALSEKIQGSDDRSAPRT